MAPTDLTALKNEVLDLIGKKKHGNVVKKLLGGFKKLEPDDYDAMGEIFKAIIEADLEQFNDKIYKGFMFMASARYGAKLVDFEKHFIKNFCKLPGEDFKIITEGWLQDGNSEITGMLYISNYRIIASGKKDIKQARLSGMGLEFIRLGSYAVHKSVSDSIAKSVAADMEASNILNYGHIYPFKDNYDIGEKKIKKGVIKYTVDVPFTDKKGKDKVSNMNVTVIVKKGPKMEKYVEKVAKLLKENSKS
ncbi:MAG: hypothetical protein ACXABO_09705 [Promethearchaeota archaeon]|jgi:hypothetical protein